MVARAGILLTLLLLVWVVVLRPPAGDPFRAPARPAHGGQVTAAIQSPPADRNPLRAADDTARLLRVLTYGTLVRWNPDTLDLDPWLAERWTTAADGRSRTFRLRSGVRWSDGTPFSSADVRFTLEVLTDLHEASGAPLAGGLHLPLGLVADTPDARTVTVAARDAVALAWFATLPVLPSHRLAEARADGTLARPWPPGDGPADLPGLGPFLLHRHDARRVELARNPAWWREAPDGAPLPSLDVVVLEVHEDVATALDGLAAGTVDIVAGAVPLEAFVPLQRGEQEGRLQLVDLGVVPEVEALWFCVRPEIVARHPAVALAARREFRQALSHAIDREQFAHEVYLGHAVPVWGPATPWDRAAFNPDVTRYPPDPDRARDLLAGLGLADRTGDGLLDDAAGAPVRMPLVAVADDPATARATALLAQGAAAVGIALDVDLLSADDLRRRVASCDVPAIYGRPPAAGDGRPDPLTTWLGHGVRPAWSPLAGLEAEWSREVEALMADYATAERAERQAIGHRVQASLAEQPPLLVFAAPRAYAALSPRVVVPGALRAWPPLLWRAETIGLAPSGPGAPAGL